MSFPLEKIEIGRCYLVETDQVRRVCLVTHITKDGTVRVEQRDASEARTFVWGGSATYLSAFARTVVREVPCDWRPEADRP